MKSYKVLLLKRGKWVFLGLHPPNIRQKNTK